MRSHALIVEKFIPYSFELSLISVRSSFGEVSFYPLTLNQHRNGILRVSEAPYDNVELKNIAEKYALDILEKFNYVGVMTIEFFCLNDELIANEIAPRVHNSGHWTIEGADASQFENHLRAISGLPLGSTKAKGFSAMINCIGNEPKKIEELLKIPGLHFHTYGKQPMPNRKLGHITICANNKDELTMNIKKAMNYLLEE
jgi:5-(carboxyamino)imidazole ribonucleotide synthase